MTNYEFVVSAKETHGMDLKKCDHDGCVDGKITTCDYVNAKGWPVGEREETCGRCSGRGYKLPPPGYYLVTTGSSEEPTAAKVTGSEAEFVGVDGDCSTWMKVTWICELVPAGKERDDGQR